MRAVFVLTSFFGVMSGGLSAQTTAPADSAEFLARENLVRQEFVSRHPFTPVGPQRAFFATIKSRADPNTVLDGKFVYVFAMAMKGEVEPAPPPKVSKPSYWSTLGASLLQGLPYGASIATAFSATSHITEQSTDGVNSVAIKNQQNFEAMVTRLDVASGPEFETAEPLIRTRYITRALSKLYEEVQYPCPMTVFLVDASSHKEPEDAQPNEADLSKKPANFSARQWKAFQKAAEKAKKYESFNDAEPDPPSHEEDWGRMYVQRLLGEKSKEYLEYRTYSREQKTNALARAFKAFAHAGNRVAENAAKEPLIEYLDSLGVGLMQTASGWALPDGTGRVVQDTEMIEKEFGSAALRQFLRQPEGVEKDKMRVAAFVLFTQFQMLAAGVMVG